MPDKRFDPEVADLTREVRALVNQAYKLSLDIDTAVGQLARFADRNRITEKDDRDV